MYVCCMCVVGGGWGIGGGEALVACHEHLHDLVRFGVDHEVRLVIKRRAGQEQKKKGGGGGGVGIILRVSNRVVKGSVGRVSFGFRDR